MAHWGIAMTQYQELWGAPDAGMIKLGTEEMAKARALAAKSKTSARERAYIDALSAFFAPGDVPFRKRADAYAARMDALHARFPSDVEGAAFDALAILADTPPSETDLTHPRRALAILKPLFRAHPDHPGLAHYIIHTCDTPALAQDGLEAARAYAKIAPSSPHALHMPGHIFARLGMWDEDIASNEASIKASETAEAAGQPGAAHQMHADEFLIYAYLQTGQDEKAKALTAKMGGLGAHMLAMPGMDDMKTAGHYFDNEVRAVTAMELHDWTGAAALQPGAGSEAYFNFLIAWGQGTAAGYLHDAKLAASALAAYDASVEALKTSPYASEVEGMQVRRDEILAWQALAEDRKDDAVALMRKAADQQDKLGQNEVDIPAREMLGDVLMMEGRPADALAEYRVALKLSPNRLNGLLSAGAAAEAAGQPEAAKGYYKAAAAQTHNAVASQRPDLLRAVKLAAS
jgi:tetratricopeptide (TPR) repeat protein